MNHDEQLGRDKAPDRYTRSGRETIDLIRDSMSDAEFVAYGLGNVIRYRDRAGAKGPAEIDESKAAFYAQMAAHVDFHLDAMEGRRGISAIDPGEPRAYRDGFAPYVRQPYPTGLHGVGR